MKKWQAIKIASVVHTLLWAVILAICVIGRLTVQRDPGIMEPMDFYFTKGIYNVFIIIAAAGIFNAALLSLSLRFVSADAITNRKVLGKVTLAFSILSNILFYLSAFLILYVNRDAVIFVPILWILCAFCSGFMLIVLGTERAAVNREK